MDLEERILERSDDPADKMRLRIQRWRRGEFPGLVIDDVVQVGFEDEPNASFPSSWCGTPVEDKVPCQGLSQIIALTAPGNPDKDSLLYFHKLTLRCSGCLKTGGAYKYRTLKHIWLAGMPEAVAFCGELLHNFNNLHKSLGSDIISWGTR